MYSVISKLNVIIIICIIRRNELFKFISYVTFIINTCDMHFKEIDNLIGICLLFILLFILLLFMSIFFSKIT